MESFCIALLSLLIINPFLPYLGLSGDINPLATVIFFVIFSISFFLPSNHIDLRNINLHIYDVFIWGFYSLIAFLQGPLYLFIYLSFLTDFKRCRLFVNSFFRWMGLFAITSVPLYVLGVRIQGISGLRDSLGARSGGFPFFASEPSALMPLILFMFLVLLSIFFSRLKDFFGINPLFILSLFALYFLFSSSGLSVTSIALSLVIFACLFCLKALYSLKIQLPLRSLLNPKSLYLLILFFLLPLLIYLILNSSRIITIASILLTFDLSNLLYQSSHRPAFLLASFNPHDYVSLLAGHGSSYWHGNYIDSVYSTAKQIGQTSGLGILTPDRVNVIRPPSTIAFIFYSYGIIGSLLLFFVYYVYLSLFFIDSLLRILPSPSLAF